LLRYGIPQTAEARCDEIAGNGSIGSAGLARKREELLSDFSTQDDAARLGRLVAKTCPAVARAAR
jgi:hypothetical protein